MLTHLGDYLLWPVQPLRLHFKFLLCDLLFPIKIVLFIAVLALYGGQGGLLKCGG